MNSKQGLTDQMMPGHSSLLTRAQILFGRNMTLLLVMLLTACVPMQPKTADVAAPESVGPIEVVSGEPQEPLSPEAAAAEAGPGQALPVRFQQPSYLINKMARAEMDEDIVEPVGADITTTSGPVTLLDIIKRLAALKNMNVSWASDVDQYVMTDVDIRADEDFFQAVENLLRQVDYFHEMQNNTLVIKYKETKDFHIAMPPRLSTISSSSSTGSAAVTSLSADTSTNRWDGVRRNLDQILDIWEEPATTTVAPAAASENSETVAAAPPAAPAAAPRTAKGYYSINELIGLITVTAPRPLLAKITDYIDSLKKELYRQVAIEAKIIEVTLEESSTTGLDWRKVLDSFNIDFELFGGTGQIHPRIGEMAISQITIPGTINAVLDAIAEQGELRVLSNPKISVMNGQPAIIYVGDNLTYIDTVTSTVSGDSANVSTSVTTAQVTSGIRLEVYPTIISDDEIIMSLTPMVSGLTTENIPYEVFGENSENKVGVPIVKEQTMNTIIRVRNGELLVVGGLIDRKNRVDEFKVRGLGDLPVINRLFKATEKEFDTTEIVILLQPRII